MLRQADVACELAESDWSDPTGMRWNPAAREKSEPLRNPLLAEVVDTWGGAVLFVGSRGFTPAHVRRRPAPGWLRMAFATRHVTGGFLEEDGEV